MKESVVFGKISHMMKIMEEDSAEELNTTRHPGFESVCLSRFVLHTAYTHRKNYKGLVAFFFNNAFVTSMDLQVYENFNLTEFII